MKIKGNHIQIYLLIFLLPQLFFCITRMIQLKYWKVINKGKILWLMYV